MKAKKRIGIWMDYTSAQIYENASGEYLLTTLESNFVMPVKQDVKLHSESLLHNKENQTDQAYFKVMMKYCFLVQPKPKLLYTIGLKLTQSSTKSTLKPMMPTK